MARQIEREADLEWRRDGDDHNSSGAERWLMLFRNSGLAVSIVTESISEAEFVSDYYR
jgi:hypothetical protein